MITISCKETLYTYNLYHLVKAFFPEEEVKQEVCAGQDALVKLQMCEACMLTIAEESEEGRFVLHSSGMDREGQADHARLVSKRRQEKEICLLQAATEEPQAGAEDPQVKKKQVTRLAYEWLAESTGRHLPWGMLTGVRPTKLAMRYLEKDGREETAALRLREEYGVSEEKARLAVQIALRERKLLQPLDLQNGYSLYVGIPFCPSICSYCSFSSFSAEAWKEQMDAYVEALCRELQAMRSLAAGRTLNTVYLGGGTPTTLSAKQLDRILSQIEESFLYSEEPPVLEYTVEAGRPDSITREKLEVLRAHPVTRISVNPQTMQQKTLDLVGRRHTVQEVKDSFVLARSLGFENINMDLIAGLPGESAEDMADTLRQIEELRPDSLTIHSLAIKRAARMGQEQQSASCEEISRMVDAGAEAAGRMGLAPYYLYRQKNIAGNFENVGYAKIDKAGIYNILIMEEKQTILAAGAGAMTKLVLPEGIRAENGKETNLLRIENVKNVREYMERIEEMMEKKTRAWQEYMGE